MTPNPTDIAAIAHRLRATRESLGLKPSEVCRAAGIAPNTYSQWESATGRPSLDQAMKLCDVFGVTLDWIYRGNRTGLPFQLASALTSKAS
jgi:transcriptional regulator with XRE-family HTH domain